MSNNESMLNGERHIHRLRRDDNNQEVFLAFTYQEWFERIWSDDCSRHWCITLKDGTKTYDLGIVRKTSAQTAGNWPMDSYAAGVDPSEVPAMMKIDAKYGVKTDYTEDGDPVFTSKGHRKKYLKVHKMHDRNAGYGD